MFALQENVSPRAAREGNAALGAAVGQRGYSLLEENTPFVSPREGRGADPSTPDIAGLQLEELRSLRIAQPLAALLPYGCGIPLAGSRVRCTWLRHGSSANRYRYQPRLTAVRRE